MAYEIPGKSVTAPSAADYRTGNGQWRFVKIGSGGAATQCSVAGERAFGVRQNTPNSGEAMTIMLDGVTMIEAGGALNTVGTLLTTDTSGRAVAASTGNNILGEQLEVASGAGIIIAMRLVPNGAKA